MVMDAGASSTDTERCDIGRVAAKVANVVSDLFKCVALVYEAIVSCLRQRETVVVVVVCGDGLAVL
jgi:hypothetical protein